MKRRRSRSGFKSDEEIRDEIARLFERQSVDVLSVLHIIGGVFNHFLLDNPNAPTDLDFHDLTRANDAIRDVFYDAVRRDKEDDRRHIERYGYPVGFSPAVNERMIAKHKEEPETDGFLRRIFPDDGAREEHRKEKIQKRLAWAAAYENRDRTLKLEDAEAASTTNKKRKKP